MTRYLALIEEHQRGQHPEPVDGCYLCEQPADGPADTPEQKLWEPDPDDIRPLPSPTGEEAPRHE